MTDYQTIQEKTEVIKGITNNYRSFTRLNLVEKQAQTNWLIEQVEKLLEDVATINNENKKLAEKLEIALNIIEENDIRTKSSKVGG